jgi:hypothetical protein
MIKSYEDIAACVTYLGNVEGSSFRLDSYVQIRACGTYRRRSQPLATFLDESRVAPTLPSQWFSTNHSVLGSKEPTLLCNQVYRESDDQDIVTTLLLRPHEPLRD